LSKFRFSCWRVLSVWAASGPAGIGVTVSVMRTRGRAQSVYAF
jgi:hypothetical protein